MGVGRSTLSKWVRLYRDQGKAALQSKLARPSRRRPKVAAAVLAHDLNHRSRPCLDGQVACRVFQDAKPALKAYTLRKRSEAFDWINELTRALIQVSAVHTQPQVETAGRLAVETWLQRNGVITITQNKKVLPIFLAKSAHNYVAPTPGPGTGRRLGLAQ